MKPSTNAQSNVFSDYFVETMAKIFNPVPVPIILVDHETRIVMINQIFADFLGKEIPDILGRKVNDVDPTSRFPEVFGQKSAEIAWKHTFSNGRTAIVHRIPVTDTYDEVIYGFGMLLFRDMREFQDIIEKNKLLESKLNEAKYQLKTIQGAKYSWDNIIGESKRMKQAMQMSQKTAKTKSNVLLLGESGTGKELFAHAIHNSSERSHEKLIKVNCSAIPQELFEAELFGYEEGAFTGAKRGGKIGKFEQAHKGSIFLDEIGEMPMHLQVKLLRVLQEREIERIGGKKTISVDIRIIAATNRDLAQSVEKGEFREDLYYRLHVMAINIPSLRERPEDIRPITESLLVKLSDELGNPVSDLTSEAMLAIEAYDWPGNVRELENVLERALNLMDNGTIERMHLPYNLLNRSDEIDQHRGSLKKQMEEIEKELIVNVLHDTGGNKLETAKRLDISRSTLYDKLEKYGLKAK